MTTVFTILSNTPWWVFALFAVLLARSVPALKPRSVPVSRVLIVPIAFFVWGLASLAQRSGGSPLLVADWLAFGAAGLAFGLRITRLDGVRIDRAAGRVTLPGSVVPLIRNLTIFAVKYALGVAVAVAPAWRSDIMPWNIAVSGLTAGYFVAWLLRFGLRYRRADQPTAVMAGVTPAA